MDDEPRINKIIFIGRHLDRRELRDAFRSCVWTPLPDGWIERFHPQYERPVYIHEATGKLVIAKAFVLNSDLGCRKNADSDA